MSGYEHSDSSSDKNDGVDVPPELQYEPGHDKTPEAKAFKSLRGLTIADPSSIYDLITGTGDAPKVKTSGKIKFVVTFLVLLVRVGLNVSQIYIKWFHKPDRDPLVAYNLSTLIQNFSEFIMINLLLLTFLWWVFYLLIANKCSSEKNYTKNVGQSSRRLVWNLNRLASFSLLQLIPSAKKLIGMLDVFEQYVYAFRLMCNNRARTDPILSHYFRDAKACINGTKRNCTTGCKVLFIPGLAFVFVIFNLAFFALGIVAFYVKMSQLSPLFVKQPANWDYPDYIAFFGIVNNVASLTDVNAISFAVVLKLVFAGGDAKITENEWRNKEAFLNWIYAACVEKRGIWYSIAKFTAVDAEEIQAVLIENKNEIDERKWHEYLAEKQKQDAKRKKKGSADDAGLEVHAEQWEKETVEIKEALAELRRRKAWGTLKPKFAHTLEKLQLVHYIFNTNGGKGDTPPEDLEEFFKNPMHVGRTYLIRLMFLMVDDDQSGTISRAEARKLAKLGFTDKIGSEFDKYFDRCRVNIKTVQPSPASKGKDEEDGGGCLCPCCRHPPEVKLPRNNDRDKIDMIEATVLLNMLLTAYYDAERAEEFNAAEANRTFEEKRQKEWLKAEEDRNAAIKIELAAERERLNAEKAAMATAAAEKKDGEAKKGEKKDGEKKDGEKSEKTDGEKSEKKDAGSASGSGSGDTAAAAASASGSGSKSASGSGSKSASASGSSS